MWQSYVNNSSGLFFMGHAAVSHPVRSLFSATNCGFENGENYSILFEMGNHYSHSTSIRYKFSLGKRRTYALPFPKIGVCNPHPKTPIAIISGRGKATNFKFGQNNSRVHQSFSEQKTIKNFREKGACAYAGISGILKYPLLSQERNRIQL